MNKQLAHSSYNKLFLGYFINSEFRMNLNQSIQWKHAEILSNSEIKEVHHHDKNYFGMYLESNKLILVDLIDVQFKIQEQLKAYCPNLNVENLKICIFAQVFIA